MLLVDSARRKEIIAAQGIENENKGMMGIARVEAKIRE
jgi:hypothetical protein